ncbi:CYTH domain-containing protein [Sulfurovum sp. NBC37-1]|uniref:CYTH domain-containing protein n=1 Tax=Sulfurovum sp. (strain NBC37-1) TaxID=387093 RepID=UPI0001587583|nr:CYTH domain-containing protein [Sulfurovum sp. NBC37-1]BAF72146.1 adenylate cyclase [Sulfurovum sp. NBC37-1]
MPKEIERKFLVDSTKLPKLPTAHHIKQGYIPTAGTATVRIRISDDRAFLTLKGKAKGLTRSEFEYGIPVEEAEMMLTELCTSSHIKKKRYLIPYGDHTWELDIFEGDNEGLIVAEIELQAEHETFQKPPWVTEEVSYDPHYRNAYLIDHPYSMWADS